MPVIAYTWSSQSGLTRSLEASWIVSTKSLTSGPVSVSSNPRWCAWQYKDRIDLGLTDRVAIVTGSSQGIGRAAALLLGKEGARVIVTDHEQRVRAEAVVSAIEACDQSSSPHRSPHRLTPREILAITDMVTAPEYRHVPTGTHAVLAQRLGTVWASPSTWYHLVRKFGWRRPRLRVHPAKPKVGLRTTRPNEMWHIDTTVIRLLDGTKAYLHAVIDNFSRRILAWRVAETFAPANSVAVLVEAGRAATPSETTPVLLADAGVENVNAQVDELIPRECCAGSWRSRNSSSRIP
jgi:Integrase core domain/short chain dehydrogenase